MTVYVDHARIPFRNMLMNHLMAGTPEEIREIAARLGLSAYIQHPDTPKECREALRLGTREMTSRQMVEIVRRKQARCSRQPQTRRPR